ncbi:MAG TPA: hypothetical protein ENJ00_05510 [Phycisphaerales bacterium]|nr:hypothetical protein [Phycisphaerales bacterium]
MGAGAGRAISGIGAFYDGYWLARHIHDGNGYSAIASGLSITGNGALASAAGSLSATGVGAIAVGAVGVAIVGGELAAQLDENANISAVNNDANRNGQCLLYEQAIARFKCKIKAEQEN